MKTRLAVIKSIILFPFLLLNSQLSNAQLKGLYVDFFGSHIIHDATLKNNLITYAQDHNFNYLLLYDVQSYILDYTLYTGGNTTPLTADQQLLVNFVGSAHNAGLQIGVTGGIYKAGSTNLNQFFDNVIWLNNNTNVTANQKIDVLHLEDEYWSATTTVYAAYVSQLIHMWNDLKNGSATIKVETYLGKINTFGTVVTASQEVSDIDPVTDRVLLECYMPNQFMQNRIDQLPPNDYVNLQFEFDYGAGERYWYFAQNSKTTTIIPIFSAESVDLLHTSNSQNYYGDYLWFEDILPNGVACPSATQTELNYPFLPLTYYNTIAQPKIDFIRSYTTNLDPYNHATYPPRPYPCGGVPNEIELCTDNANVANGNIIGGEMWFKYGLMPLKDNYKSIYLDLGQDQIIANGANTYITATEYLTDISSHVQFSGACTSIYVDHYNWYKNGELVLTTPATTPTYLATASTISFTTDIYSCEIVTNDCSPYAFSYRIRDDVKITSDPNPWVGPPEVSFQYTPETCAGNDGTATVLPHNYGSTPTYYWLGNGSMSATATGLSEGTHTVNVNNQPKYIYIPHFDNTPQPVIYSSIPFPCDNHLSVSSAYSSFQWYLNGNLISGASSHNYTATQNGTYTVTVTNSNGCSGTSSPHNLNVSVSATVTGATSTCGNNIFAVPNAGEGATYEWQIPSGASYSYLNKYSITITWGNAQYAGGTISCTVTNACGNSATGSIDVLGCCNSAGYTQKNNETTTGNVTYCGQKFNINGVYRILNGHSVTFDNCLIQFSNDARIEVDHGATLTIKSTCSNANGITRSHLYACGTGWTGIHLDDNYSLLSIDDALIENAQSAVSSHNSGEFHITNSDFFNNTTSVWATDGNYSSCTVTRNNFDCPSCGGNTSGIEHISANHAEGLTINGNLIKNCEIGIHSNHKSTTHALGNTFRDISNAGIFAENDGSIDVSSLNIFDNCEGGVVASNSVDAYVDGNSFSQGKVAVITQLCANRKINVNNNEIVNPTWIGIAGLFNYPCNQSYYNNTISFSPDQLVYGIAIGESNLVQPGLKNLIDINGNHIFDAAYGISVSNDYNTLITENDIHFINPNTHKTYGIMAQNSHYPIIVGNTVKDESQLNEAQFGITVEQGGGAILCSNTVDGMFQGIIFAGNMLGTNVQVKLNIMENSDIGFVLRNGGDIGLQGDMNGIYYNNQWINNGYDSYSYGSNISNTSHFPVSTANYNTPYIISTHGNDGQNGAYDVLTMSSNAINQYTVNCEGDIKDPTEDARMVVDDMLTYSVDPEETKWLSKSSVLDALKYKNDIDATDLEIQSFEALADNEAMGELRSLKEEYASAFTDTTIAGGDSTIIEQVKAANQQVSDQNMIETYHKIVNDIYLKTAAVNKKDFNLQQTESLQLIASLCPYEAGSAVYTAQWILFYKEGIFYTSNNCNDDSPMRFSHAANKISSSFMIYPNPTDSKVTLSYIVKDDRANYYVRLYDNIGKILSEQKLNSKAFTTSIDMSPFTPGLYHYEIFENTHQINSGKISVVR